METPLIGMVNDIVPSSEDVVGCMSSPPASLVDAPGEAYFENMETVPLELEEEAVASCGGGDAGGAIETTHHDTVKFETEAEDGPSLIQSYFKDSPTDIEFNVGDAVSIGSNFLDQLTNQPDNKLPVDVPDNAHNNPTSEDDAEAFQAQLNTEFKRNVDRLAESISDVQIEDQSNTRTEWNVPEPPLDSKFRETGLEEEKSSTELSRFFADDKHGSDKVGKAFFDVLAQTISPPATAAFADQLRFDELFPTFDSSVHSNELDDCYSAWIPKEDTKQALMTLASTPPGTYFPEKENLTMPGVIMNEELKDPVKDLARQCLSEDIASQRVTLTADNINQDEDGLCKLLNVGCYRAAINLTTRLLTLHGQGLARAGHPSRNSSQSLQIWHVRLALLLKLRLFNMAEAESEPFGDLDKPDLYYEFYPDVHGSRKGSMVPFSFRTLVPQILTCVGKFGEAIDQLFLCLGTVTKIIDNLEKGFNENGNLDERPRTTRQASLKLWKRREIKVLFTISNSLVAQNDFYSAYTLLDSIATKSPQNIANIRSAQGRIMLQLGDVKLAQVSFNLAAGARGNTDKEKVATLIDRALVCCSHNNFTEAHSLLKEAHSLDAHNPTVINNMAVVLLYMGKLHDSCQLLEEAIAGSPKGFLHECLLVNICTLYDLESSRSMQKKAGMLEVVSRHAGDGFNVFCLKLQSVT